MTSPFHFAHRWLWLPLGLLIAAVIPTGLQAQGFLAPQVKPVIAPAGSGSTARISGPASRPAQITGNPSGSGWVVRAPTSIARPAGSSMIGSGGMGGSITGAPPAFELSNSKVLVLPNNGRLNTLLTRPSAGLANTPEPSVFKTDSSVSLQFVVNGGLVSTAVPVGTAQITLEVASGKGWKPVDTQHIVGVETTVGFTLPEGATASTLRVRATAARKFTLSQSLAESTFSWPEGTSGVLTNAGSGSLVLNGGPIAVPAAATPVSGNTVSLAAINSGPLVANTVATTPTTTTSLVLNGGPIAVPAAATPVSGNTVSLAATNSGPLVANTAATTPTTTTATPEAVESDIWKIIGNRLFFFNQYRGMQVFDMSDPVHPVKTGSQRMAAVGELFYALDANGDHLGLLAQNCSKNAALGISTLHLLAVSSAGQPSIINQVPLNGYIADSRLIGTRLYVLLSNYDPTTYASVMSLVGYDLADPAAPVDLGSVPVPGGYYMHLQASGSYLMVANSFTGGWSWGGTAGSKLAAVDISGDGHLRLVKTVTTKGYVADQFKMQVVDGHLVAVSQLQQQNTWLSNSQLRIDPRQTWVETFALNNDVVEPEAQLQLNSADGEELFATRFDGSRLYVVTYGIKANGPTIIDFTQRSWDPLYVVDLADPVHPAVLSELELPGWSTYIETDGDRILAVGVEDWKVAVSYFDVSDPTSLRLLSRVYPGDGSHYTWSEANYDHKAVNWMKEDGKVFLPFQSWDWSTGTSVSATQVINVSRDAITLGSAIENKGTARRGSVVNGYLASISGRQLVVTTNPAVGEAERVAWVELSWPVDRVVALDKFLIQLEDGNRYGWWGYLNTSTQESVLRLSNKADPDTVLDSVTLGAGNIIGVEQRGNLIYVAQSVPADGINGPLLRTWAIGLTAAQKIDKVCDVATQVDADTFGRLNTAATQALWINQNTLAWYVPVQPNYGWYWGYPIFIRPGMATTGTLIGNTGSISLVRPFPGNSGSPTSDVCAIVCPVAIDTTSQLTAGESVTVTIPSDGSLRSVGKAYTSNGFVFFSAERGDAYYYGWWPVLTLNGTTSTQAKIRQPGEVCSSLHVLDFRDGQAPVVRDPASLAGTLIGVAGVDDNGAYLITQRTRDNGNKLHSLAYDGVRAHKIDALDTDYWTALDSVGNRVFYALPETFDADGKISAAAQVKSVRCNALTGMLERVGNWQLAESVYSLNVVGNLLLASRWGDLEVATISSDLTLTPRAQMDQPTNLWLNVERAASDPSAAGLWLPAGDYGVEFFNFRD